MNTVYLFLECISHHPDDLGVLLNSSSVAKARGINQAVDQMSSMILYVIRSNLVSQGSFLIVLIFNNNFVPERVFHFQLTQVIYDGI